MKTTLINHRRKRDEKEYFESNTGSAFGLIAGYNVYNSQKSDVMSELALANVEALADDEIVTPTECPGGSVTYYDRNGEDTI